MKWLDVTFSDRKKLAGPTLLLIILISSLVSISFGLQSSRSISATGLINYVPRMDITVNVDKIIVLNNLSIGFQLDWERWKHFVDRPFLRQLARNANFKLIRVFDFRKTSSYGYPDLMPCTYWDETTKTGTWDWTQVDALTQAIFSAGAEPLFCLGWAYRAGEVYRFVPRGMGINPVTQLPYPDSYAAYAAEWVKHFKQLRLPVRFYEIMNEPFCYFGWNGGNVTRLGYFVEFWNTVARAMRQQNPNILLSHDTINQKRVFDYWVTHGDNVDFIDFHKYDSNIIGKYTEDEMFRRAERMQFETTMDFYGIAEARQRWFNSRGKWLLAVNSESNYNSAWENGTDPKIPQMAGAVWLALVLRMGILKGLDYSIYFEFANSKSWSQAHGDGWGFGMINSDDNKPWYPYYVHEMIGENLALNDPVLEAFSSSEDVRVLAWRNGIRVNVLLICKINETRVVSLRGIVGQLTVLWIDGTIPFSEPAIQSKIIDANEVLQLTGYAVMLLQSNV